MSDDGPITKRERPLFRVLYIEDNPSERDSLEYLMGDEFRERIHFDMCPSVKEVDDYKIAKGIDCVLLDLGLSDTTGIGTYRAFRKRAPSLPVVVFSGTLDDDIREEIEKDGVRILPKFKRTTQAVFDAIRRAINAGAYHEQRQPITRHAEQIERDAVRVLDSTPPEDKAQRSQLEMLIEQSRQIAEIKASDAHQARVLSRLESRLDRQGDSVADLEKEAAKGIGMVERTRLEQEGATKRTQWQSTAKVVATVAASFGGGAGLLKAAQELGWM